MKITQLIVIYEALCFDVAQGRMNGTPKNYTTYKVETEMNVLDMMNWYLLVSSGMFELGSVLFWVMKQ